MKFSKTGITVYGRNSKDIAIKAEQTVSDFKANDIDLHFNIKPCSLPGTPFLAEFTRITH